MEIRDLASLVSFNDTAADYQSNTTLVQLFEEQCDKGPEKVALIFKGETFTYRQLNEVSNQLAHYIRSIYKIEPDDVIGVKLERSQWMIITILGVLKAGAAYMPIDPGFQQERIDYMVNNSQCKLLIDNIVLNFVKQQLYQFDTNNPIRITNPKDLAYVIYTSGSTGRPKGVMVEHQGVVNRIEWMWQQYAYTAADVILQKTTYTFDVSVWEIFMPLCWGTKMVLCEKEDIASPDRILSLIKHYKITCLHFVPSMLSVFISALFDHPEISKELSSLKCVITSGEALPAKTVQNWYKKINVPIHNLYGPTEASVDVTYYETKKTDTVIPIGKPIWNTQIHIVDHDHNLVSIGEMGEICISGDGLARGYLNNPELTEEKFVVNPFREGQKMYKTGDYGRWLPDGNIEYLGRMDDQVKIRGYRIELGEIEKVMTRHEGINQCTVVKKDQGDASRLICYYVPDWRYIKTKERELYNRQVANWQELFETEYEKTEGEKDIDEEFNFIGWGDSFTGELIPENHMREWLSDIIAFIKQEQPQNVLEIGCGTGMIFYQLAGHIKKYIGTDISKSGINQIKKRIDKGLRNYGDTEFKVCAAHEISLPENEQVDTIILNSIVQFFSGEDYLTDVIEKCIRLLNGHGRIIIGDVRDYRLLYAFKARLQAQKLNKEISLKEFKDDIDQQVLKEEEICFSPDYFYSLCSRFPQISFIDIEGKQGDCINELTLYRYNVTLHVGIEKPQLVPQWQTWKDSNEEEILQKIEQGNKIIALKEVPNPRLWQERQMQKLLNNASIQTLDSLVGAIKNKDTESKLAENIIQTAKAKGYHCHILLDNDPMHYNLVFEQQQSYTFIKPLYNPTYNSVTFTNIPLFGDINTLLQKEVKEHLKQYLPDYMIPSDFMALQKIPLNANGKADKKALPDINLSINDFKNYVEPRNKVERIIAGIWSELLGIKSISAFDNFFDLGGNSLMAVQVMGKLEKELGAKLPLAILFQHPTVQKLADLFLSKYRTINWDSLVPLKSTGNKIPLYFVHGANGDVLFLRSFASQMHRDQPVYALRPQGISGTGKILNNVEDMAALYIKEVLKHNPNGPYALGGYSFGGYVAFEMARRLKDMGKEVIMVALFDTDALSTDFEEPRIKKIIRKSAYPILRMGYLVKLLTQNFKRQLQYEKEVWVRGLLLRKRNLFGPKDDYHYYRLIMEKTCYKARDKYKLKPLDIQVELFRAKERTCFMYDQNFLGWKKFALKGVNVHNVPGAHHLMFTQPNGDELGQILQYCLDNATNKEEKHKIISSYKEQDFPLAE